MGYIKNTEGTAAYEYSVYKEDRLTPGLVGESIEQLGNASPGVRRRLLAVAAYKAHKHGKS